MSRPAVRTRLAPEARTQQILAEAARMTIEHGAFPLHLDVLADRVGISKALIYRYFPTQYDLANALVAQRLDALAAEGIDAAIDDPDWRRAARACADIYQQETAANGPLLHILLSDLYLARRIAPDLLARYRQIMGRLARRLRRAAGLPAAEAVSALAIITSIPEEAGTMASAGRLDFEAARAIAHAMTIGAVEELSRASASPGPARARPAPGDPTAPRP